MRLLIITALCCSLAIPASARALAYPPASPDPVSSTSNSSSSGSSRVNVGLIVGTVAVSAVFTYLFTKHRKKVRKARYSMEGKV